MEIRDATVADLPAMLEIYNDVILTTTAVFTEAPVSLEEYQTRFQTRSELGHPTLVAAAHSQVAGFATYGDFRAWPCYRYTAEHSVHVAKSFRGRGLGRNLLEAICVAAAQAGKHALIGGIDATNVISLQLHAGLGFERVAHLKEVGRKFDRWLDLVFVERLLAAKP